MAIPLPTEQAADQSEIDALLAEADSVNPERLWPPSLARHDAADIIARLASTLRSTLARLAEVERENADMKAVPYPANRVLSLERALAETEASAERATADQRATLAKWMSRAKAVEDRLDEVEEERDDAETLRKDRSDAAEYWSAQAIRAERGLQEAREALRSIANDGALHGSMLTRALRSRNIARQALVNLPESGGG